MKLPCSKLPLIIKESALALPATPRKLRPIPSAIAFTTRINILRTNGIPEVVLDPVGYGTLDHCNTSLVIHRLSYIARYRRCVVDHRLARNAKWHLLSFNGISN